MQSGYLIFNPHAGRFPSRMLTVRAADVLAKNGWDIQHKQTSGGQEITELAQQAVEENMDLWLFTGETVFETVEHAWNLISGRHLQSDKARCIPFEQLYIYSDQPMDIQLDGEPMKGNHEVKIDVHPKALGIMVPDKVSWVLFSED